MVASLRDLGYELALPQAASLWNRSYLRSLGIEVTEVEEFKELWDVEMPLTFKHSRCEFLCGLDLSTPEKLQSALDNDSADDLAICFLQDLSNVIEQLSVESAVEDLGKSLLAVAGIKRLSHISIFGRLTDFSLLMREEEVDCNPDICVEKKPSKIILVVQTIKDDFRNDYTVPYAQLAAQMIAAFGQNRDRGYVKSSQRMYGFTMYGSYCTFYRLDVDEEVFKSVSKGTIQSCTRPPIAKLRQFSFKNRRHTSFLIKDKDNMRQTLQVFEALRGIFEAA